MTKTGGWSSRTSRQEDSIAPSSSKNPSNNPQIIEDPDITEAEAKIWISQVIIPCPNSPHAFLGPFPKEKKEPENSAVFPCYEQTKPLIFSEGPYDLSFLKNKFRTEPKINNNEQYIEWLNKVEKKKSQF